MKTELYFGLILLTFLSVNENVRAQCLELPCWAWAKSLSATNGIYGHAIAIDPQGTGDIYIAGGFEGTTDFDPGPGTYPLNSGSSQDVGNFVSKYDGSGNFIWAKAMANAGSAGSVYSMAIDPSGSGAIYTTGRIWGTIDFDPGPNEFNLTSAGINDVFVSKLDIAGNFVWAKVMGGPDEDFGISLAFDPGGDGSVYTTGQFRGTADFDPDEDSTFNLTSAGNYDIFISKLDGEGNFVWAIAFGGTADDVGRAIAFDPEGNGSLYTMGQFFGTVDFDPGDNTFDLITTGNHQNFISKLDGSGNFVWAQQMGKLNLVAYDRFGSIALDPGGSGDIYITGPFKGTEDFDPGVGTDTLNSAGDTDVFISKLSDAGEFKWAGAIGGPSQDDCIDIAFQPEENGNVFTLGMFKDSADFDPGPDLFKLASEGEQDLFISNFDMDGNLQWVKAVQGVANAYGQSLVADGNSVYMSGAFFGTAISFDSITLTNVNPSGPDLFMAKLDFRVATNDLDAKAQKINLYPNPATNELTIEIDGDEFFNVDITMFNALGEVVYFIPNESIIHKKSIDISALIPGIYFVELKMDGNSMVEKVVKQ